MKNCPLADSFFYTCGAISYGSGWREDVINQCLEFDQKSHLYFLTLVTLSISRQFFYTCGAISYGSGWREDVVNQCLEFDQKSHLYFLILVTVQPPLIAKEQPGKL